MTTITGTALDAAGAPVIGRTVAARLIAATSALADPGGQIITAAETTTGEGGAWSLELTPLSRLVEPGGAYYVVTVGPERYTITVPDDGTHELGTVLIVPGPLPSTAATTAALDAHVSATTDAHGIAEALAELSMEYLALTGGRLTGDLEVADPGVKGYRLRRSGTALDLDGTGADLFVSVFSGADYDGAQRTYIRLEAGTQLGHLVGPWVWAASPFGGALIEGTPSDTPGVATLGFFGAPPVTRPVVSGSLSGDLAGVVASLVSALAALGLVTDSTAE